MFELVERTPAPNAVKEQSIVFGRYVLELRAAAIDAAEQVGDAVLDGLIDEGELTLQRGHLGDDAQVLGQRRHTRLRKLHLVLGGADGNTQYSNPLGSHLGHIQR